MDVITIPLVSAESSVRNALELCRRKQRSGVVFLHGRSRYHVLHAGNLLEARAEQVDTVGEVEGGHEVLVLELSRAQRFGLDLDNPGQTWEAYEKMFASEGVDYGILPDPSGSSATIVTHHEEQAAELGLSGGYECSGSPTHYFPKPRVRINETCPKSHLCGKDSKIRPAR